MDDEVAQAHRALREAIVRAYTVDPEVHLDEGVREHGMVVDYVVALAVANPVDGQTSYVVLVTDGECPGYRTTGLLAVAQDTQSYMVEED